MILPVKGFVIFEAVLGLTLLLSFSLLLLSWQASRTRQYQKLHEMVQGLCLAQSIVDQIILQLAPRYSNNFWNVYIEKQKDLCLPLIYLTVALSPKKDPQALLTLNTAYVSHE